MSYCEEKDCFNHCELVDLGDDCRVHCRAHAVQSDRYIWLGEISKEVLDDLIKTRVEQTKNCIQIFAESCKNSVNRGTNSKMTVGLICDWQKNVANDLVKLSENYQFKDLSQTRKLFVELNYFKAEYANRPGFIQKSDCKQNFYIPKMRRTSHDWTYELNLSLMYGPGVCVTETLIKRENIRYLMKSCVYSHIEDVGFFEKEIEIMKRQRGSRYFLEFCNEVEEDRGFDQELKYFSTFPGSPLTNMIGNVTLGEQTISSFLTFIQNISPHLPIPYIDPSMISILDSSLQKLHKKHQFLLTSFRHQHSVLDPKYKAPVSLDSNLKLYYSAGVIILDLLNFKSIGLISSATKFLLSTNINKIPSKSPQLKDLLCRILQLDNNQDCTLPAIQILVADYTALSTPRN